METVVVILGVWAFLVTRLLLSLRMALAVLDEVHDLNLRLIAAHQFDKTINYSTLPRPAKFIFDLTLWTRSQAIRRYADQLVGAA